MPCGTSAPGKVFPALKSPLPPVPMEALTSDTGSATAAARAVPARWPDMVSASAAAPAARARSTRGRRASATGEHLAEYAVGRRGDPVGGDVGGTVGREFGDPGLGVGQRRG